VGVLKQEKGFYKSVFALMIPLIIQNLISQSVALADTFMVGFTGEAGLAAVTLANTPFFVLMVFTFGVQSGVGILVSQYWGKDNKSAINRVCGVGVYVAFAVSAIFATVMIVIPEAVLELVTNEDSLIGIASTYARIVGISQILTSVSQVYIAAQRSCENPRLGVIVLASSSLINVFGNWLLIFGNSRLGIAPMGVEGAAWATLFSRVVELIVVIIYAGRNKHLPLQIKYFLKPGRLIFRDFIKYSLPVVINEALWGVSLMLYPVIFGHMKNPQALLAAYTIAGNLEKLFTVAVFASGNTVAVVIGKELGAGRTDTVYGIAKSLSFLGLLLGLGSGLILLVSTLTFMRPLVYPLFDLSSDAARAATSMLIILSSIVPLRNCGFALGIGVLRGGGDVKALAIIDVGTLYVFALPFAAVTGLILHLDVAVVYSAVAIEEVVKTILLIFRFRTKKWIRNVTRENI